MGFSFAFRPQPPSPGYIRREELPDRDDDYFSMIVKSCSLLAEVERSEFSLSGFGRVRWNVDVAYDMSAFLEAVPDLVQDVERQRFAEVDLYSQGVECQLGFRPVRADVEVRCSSSTAWTPVPEVEIISRSDLLQMIRRLQQDFVQGLAMIDPALVGMPPFDDWVHNDLRDGRLT